MPIECAQLRKQPEPLLACPKCRAEPFNSEFMRGMVQSWWRRLFGLPYCCIICNACMSIVGYEKPTK